jgi:hypothetical protein
MIVAYYLSAIDLYRSSTRLHYPLKLPYNNIVSDRSSPLHSSDRAMKMSFNRLTRTLLEQYATCAPDPTAWPGPWTNILSTLFPASKGYLVSPMRRKSPSSDFIFEVATDACPADTFRTVLIVEIKDPRHWDHGIPVLMQQIAHQTELAFLGSATQKASHKVYWIGTIGSHWIYGEKEDDDQPPKPLIEWHDVTHDDASYCDFLQLVELVGSL